MSPHLKVSGPPSGALLLPLPATPKARAVPARPKSVVSHCKGGIERDLWIGWVEPVCGEDWKCQVGSAARPVPLPAGRHYWGREIPSFLIFSCKVERFIPRRAAAPVGPATTQPVSRRAPRMCSRSASASVFPEVGGQRSERRFPTTDL